MNKVDEIAYIFALAEGQYEGWFPWCHREDGGTGCPVDPAASNPEKDWYPTDTYKMMKVFTWKEIPEDFKNVYRHFAQMVLNLDV